MAPDDREPVKLDAEDRRRLYGLLEADIIPRLRRIELGGAALTIAVASPKLGGPSVGEVVAATARLFFG